MTDAAADARVVLLNLLSRPATVATLSALQIDSERCFSEWDAGWHPLNNDAELWPMRLTRGQVAEAHCAPPITAGDSPAWVDDAAAAANASRMMLIGAGRPVQSSNEAAP